jgi:hypothetical protein
MKCASGALLPILLLVLPWCLTACGKVESSVPAETLTAPVDPAEPTVVSVHSEKIRITDDRIDWRWRIESPVPLKIKGRNTRRMPLIRAGSPEDTGKDSRSKGGSTHIEIHLTAECTGKRDGSMNIRSDVLLVGEDSTYAMGPVVRNLEESVILSNITFQDLPETLSIPSENTLYSIAGQEAVLVLR